MLRLARRRVPQAEASSARVVREAGCLRGFVVSKCGERARSKVELVVVVVLVVVAAEVCGAERERATMATWIMETSLSDALGGPNLC